MPRLAQDKEQEASVTKDWQMLKKVHYSKHPNVERILLVSLSMSNQVAEKKPGDGGTVIESIHLVASITLKIEARKHESNLE